MAHYFQGYHFRGMRPTVGQLCLEMFFALGWGLPSSGPALAPLVMVTPGLAWYLWASLWGPGPWGGLRSSSQACLQPPSHPSILYGLDPISHAHSVPRSSEQPKAGRSSAWMLSPSGAQSKRTHRLYAVGPAQPVDPRPPS